MSKVDWSKAPDDAEFYAIGNFYKFNDDGALIYKEARYQLPSWELSGRSIDSIRGSRDYEKRPEQQAIEPKKDGNKYHREIIGFCGAIVEVDVYRVLDAFKTGSPAIDHAIKKMLCTGIRGHKDYLTDIDNAIESLQEARLLHLQKQKINEV